MSENTQNKNVNDDEIDLIDLFRRMGRTLVRWSRAIGKSFLISVVFLLRRWLPLAVSLVVAIGVSYLLKTTSASFYTSDMVIRNNTNSNTDIKEYINKLHSFCIEKNDVALLNALSMESGKVINIMDINAYWIIDKSNDGIPDYVDYTDNHDVYDTIDVRMNDRLAIRVKIKSPQELSVLQNGIISFLERDSLFQQRNRLRLRQNQELLKRLDYDIELLDSLQLIKYFVETKNNQSKNGGQMIFLQEQKTQLLYSDIQSLYSRKQVLETERDLYPDIVTVLSEFDVPAKPVNGILFYGKIFIPLFFGITLFLLIILANKKKLKEVYEKY